MITPDEIRDAVDELLSDSVAANKRRAAIRQGRREPFVGDCDHANWDRVRCWCNDCGVTAKELAEREI